jgi:hypothetical protein
VDEPSLRFSDLDDDRGNVTRIRSPIRGLALCDRNRAILPRFGQVNHEQRAPRRR